MALASVSICRGSTSAFANRYEDRTATAGIIAGRSARRSVAATDALEEEKTVVELVLLIVLLILLFGGGFGYYRGGYYGRGGRYGIGGGFGLVLVVLLIVWLARGGF